MNVINSLLATSTTAEMGFVHVRDLYKSFSNRGGIKLEVLNNISLNIQESTFISIVGPSGCGKSTLIMMIAGLRVPTKGEVFIKGVQVTKPYTQLGIVFQRDNLLEWRTVIANVMLPIEIAGLSHSVYLTRAHKLLETVGLGEFQNYYPWQLSGGMRQRVAICRALIHDPPMIMMDEPFGALDALTRDSMSEELQKIWLNDKKTVFFVTHSITEAVFLSDIVVVMSPRPGQIIEEIKIDLPRPRTIEQSGNRDFAHYSIYIRELLERSGAFKV